MISPSVFSTDSESVTGCTPLCIYVIQYSHIIWPHLLQERILLYRVEVTSEIESFHPEN